MARYVEVDELKAKINANAWSNPVVPIYVNKVIDRTPTADVAPRSEVAREIFEEIEKEIKSALKSNCSVRSERMKRLQLEMADEFIAHIEGKIDALRGMEWFIDELKQKYTEEQK